MAENSEIAWTDHTFNPWIGCTKVSAGCANCYAEADFDKRKGFAKWGPQGTRVVTSEANWKKPLKWNKDAAAGKRARVFCASLADVFEDWPGPMVNVAGTKLWATGLVAPAWIASHMFDRPPNPDVVPLTMTRLRARLLKLIHLTPNLDWLLLTKRAAGVGECLRKVADCATNMGADQDARDGAELAGQWLYGSPMPNVWLGTSVENQAAADERIPHLLNTPAAVRFLSCEPLIGTVDLRRIPRPDGYELDALAGRLKGTITRDIIPSEKIDWVIVGGESGPNSRSMQLGWARSLVAQCKAAGTKVFVKQLGGMPSSDDDADAENSKRDGTRFALNTVILADRKGGDPEEWPADLRVREFPEVHHA